MGIIITLLQDKKEKTRALVENIIDAEQNCLFTNDSDHLTTRADVVPQQEQQ